MEKLLKKLEKRLKRLKYAKSLTHPSGEDNYYYSGRIEEIEYVIDKIRQL